MMLIGNKKCFAIEYHINAEEPYLLGFFCLWLNGLLLGAIDEEIMLESHAHLLQLKISLLCEGKLNCKEQLLDNTAEQILDYFNNQKKDNGLNLFNLPGSFDDFNMYIYEYDSKVFIVWKLFEETYYQYGQEYQGIHVSSMLIEDFTSVVNGFISVIRKCEGSGSRS
jgi:hypothetical protein